MEMHFFSLNHILSLKITHQKCQETSFFGKNIFNALRIYIFYYRKYIYYTLQLLFAQR